MSAVLMYSDLKTLLVSFLYNVIKIKQNLPAQAEGGAKDMKVSWWTVPKTKIRIVLNKWRPNTTAEWAPWGNNKVQ